MTSLFRGLVRGPRKNRLRLVVGLNRVDEIPPGGWDDRLNLPSSAQETSIARRCEYLVRELADRTGLPVSSIEYYSATRRYRLENLLAAVVRYTRAGFRLEDAEPKDPFELADDDVRAFADEQRRKRQLKARDRSIAEQVIDRLEPFLSGEDLWTLRDRYEVERKVPPRLTVIGKAGVGKTSTINALFNAEWKTSHVLVGTTDAQLKEFELQSGGSLTVVDLPGYGRTIREDREYERIYREHVPDSDLVLLVLQADTRDIAQDERMILKIQEWLGQRQDPGMVGPASGLTRARHQQHK